MHPSLARKNKGKRPKDVGVSPRTEGAERSADEQEAVAALTQVLAHAARSEPQQDASLPMAAAAADDDDDDDDDGNDDGAGQPEDPTGDKKEKKKSKKDKKKKKKNKEKKRRQSDAEAGDADRGSADAQPSDAESVSGGDADEHGADGDAGDQADGDAHDASTAKQRRKEEKRLAKRQKRAARAEAQASSADVDAAASLEIISSQLIAAAAARAEEQQAESNARGSKKKKKKELRSDGQEQPEEQEHERAAADASASGVASGAGDAAASQEQPTQPSVDSPFFPHQEIALLEALKNAGSAEAAANSSDNANGATEENSASDRPTRKTKSRSSTSGVRRPKTRVSASGPRAPKGVTKSKELTILDAMPFSDRDVLAKKVYSIQQLKWLEEERGIKIRRGRFGAEEAEKVEKAVEDFCKERDMSRDDLVQLLFHREDLQGEQYLELFEYITLRLEHRANRTVRQYVRHHFDPLAKQGAWTEEQKGKLAESLRLHGKNWKMAERLTGRKAHDCWVYWRDYGRKQEETAAAAAAAATGTEGTTASGDGGSQDAKGRAVWRADEVEKLRSVVLALEGTEAVGGKTSLEAGFSWKLVRQQMDSTRPPRRLSEKWRSLKAFEDRTRAGLKMSQAEHNRVLLERLERSRALREFNDAAAIDWTEVQCAELSYDPGMLRRMFRNLVRSTLGKDHLYRPLGETLTALRPIVDQAYRDWKEFGVDAKSGGEKGGEDGGGASLSAKKRKAMASSSTAPPSSSSSSTRKKPRKGKQAAASSSDAIESDEEAAAAAATVVAAAASASASTS